MSKFSYVEASKFSVTHKDVLLIASYELGELIKCQMNVERFGPACYENLSKASVADLLAMIAMFCELKGWNLELLRAYGQERYIEKQQEFRR